MDINMVKAGSVDFSWINKGITDGKDYALKQAQMDQQKELTMARLKENDQAKDTLTFQKLNLLTGQIKDYTEALPGPVKKAKKQQLMASAELLGVRLSPTAIAMFEDPNYVPQVSEFLKLVAEMTPEEQLGAYDKIVANLGKDNADAMMKVATEQLKAQRETDKAAREAANDEATLAIKNQELRLKGQEVNLKGKEVDLKGQELERNKAKDLVNAEVARIRAGAADKTADASLMRANTGEYLAAVKSEIDRIKVGQGDRKLGLEETKQLQNLELKRDQLEEVMRSNQVKEGQGEKKIGISQQQADATTLNSQTNVKKAEAQADLGQQRVDVSKGQLGVSQQNAAVNAGRAQTDKAYKQAKVDEGLARITTANDALKLKGKVAQETIALREKLGKLSAGKKTAAGGGVGSPKLVKELRDAAEKKAKDYDDFNASVGRLDALLQQDNGISDLASIQQFLKLVGDSRVTVSELNSMGKAGSALDRLQIFGQKLATGQKLTPDMRAQMREAVGVIRGAKSAAERAAYEPIYNSAMSPEYGLSGALNRGLIIRPNKLKAFFGNDTSSAPSEQNKPMVSGGKVSARLNTPQPFNDAQKTVISKMVAAGTPVSVIRATLAKRGIQFDPKELAAIVQAAKKGTK